VVTTLEMKKRLMKIEDPGAEGKKNKWKDTGMLGLHFVQRMREVRKKRETRP